MNDGIQSAFNNTPTGILRQARVACFDFGVHGVCEGGGWKWAGVLCRVAGEPARDALGGEVSRCNGVGGGGGLMRVLGGSSPCLASAFPFSLRADSGEVQRRKQTRETAVTAITATFYSGIMNKIDSDSLKLNIPRMNTLIKHIVLVVVCNLFSGCAVFKLPTATVDRLRINEGKGNAFVAAFDASSRASVVSIDKTGKLTVVAEVPPDVIVSSTVELLGKISAANKSGEITGEAQVRITEAVTQLGRRTAAVNILRDALYRLQEMRNNTALSEHDEKLFSKVLEAAVSIATAETYEYKASYLKEVKLLVESLKQSGGSAEDQKQLIKKLFSDTDSNTGSTP